MPVPEVVSGPRSEMNYPARGGVFDPATPRFVEDTPQPKTNRAVWIARYRNYRHSFTAKRDSVINGETIRAVNNDARFDEHVLVLDLDREEHQDIHARLLKSEQHGLNRNFWLQSEQDAAEKAARVQQAVDLLKDPEVVAALQTAAGSRNFPGLETLVPRAVAAAEPEPAEEDEPEAAPQPKRRR